MNLFFNKNNHEKFYKTGLVLSGGGTRGFAHLGVIKALEEKNMKPDIITGVSAGAIAGALYADGKSPEEIVDALSSRKVMNYLNLAFPKTGFIKMTGFEKTLDKLFKAKKFEDLKIPIKVYAVNMNTGVYTCFDEGPLAPAMTATSSIPILFPPVEINGNCYSDGGIMNNFPVEPLVGKCKIIIGVNVNPIKEDYKLDNLKKIVERTLHLSIRSHTQERKKYCDLFIEPEGIEIYGMMNIASAQDTFRMGYEATIKALESDEWKMKKEGTIKPLPFA